MVLFKDYHLPMIRSGSKTVTRREWEQPQASVGGVYMAATEMFTSHEAADCYIQVTAVYEQPLGEMTDEDARREGDYDDLDDFIDGYEKVYGKGAWDPEKVVWVVEFVYVGRSKPDLTRRMAGCPNCDLPSGYAEAREVFKGILMGYEDSSDMVCGYHRAEMHEETREYMAEQEARQ